MLPHNSKNDEYEHKQTNDVKFETNDVKFDLIEDFFLYTKVYYKYS